jgi:hypothetical protein
MADPQNQDNDADQRPPIWGSMRYVESAYGLSQSTQRNLRRAAGRETSVKPICAPIGGRKTGFTRDLIVVSVRFHLVSRWFHAVSRPPEASKIVGLRNQRPIVLSSSHTSVKPRRFTIA